MKDKTLENLQTRIVELEQENVRLQAELAAGSEYEKTLREAETLYRTITHFAYDWVYWEAPDGSLRYVSPSCERITGYTPDEFMADPQLIDTIIVPEDHKIWAKYQHEPDRTHEQAIQFRIQCRNGEIRWLEHICRPVIGDDGTFDGFRVANRDISRRKQAEADRRKSEALLAESQRIAHLGHWDWNIETGELSWSDEIYRIFGLQPQEFGATYDAFLQSVHPDDRDFVQQAVDEALNREKPYSIDHRIVWPDGTERVVHEQGEVTFNDDGRPVRMLGTVQDVTERVQIEEALRASQIRFANILDIALEAIISVDESHRVILFNKGAEQIFGYSADEVKGQPLEMLLPERFRDAHKKHMSVFAYASISARRMAERMPIFGRRKNGEEFPAEASISRLRVSKENIFTVILRDISARIQAERELAQYREQLEELVTARTTELTRTNKVLEKEIAERTRVEERLKEQDFIISKSPVIVFLWRNDEGWPVDYVSDNIHEFGYIPQDFYTERVCFADIVHPDDLEQVEAEVAEYSRDGRSGFIQKYRLVTHDGHVRWVEDRTWIRRNENNEITHFQGVVYDITERKQAELAIRRANDELQQHVEELSTLNLITQTVTTITDLDTVLSVVAGILLQLFDAYGTEITLLHGGKARLTIFVRHNEDGTSEKKQNPLIPVADSPVAQRVIETGQPLLVLKAQTNPLSEPIHKILRAQDIQSLMSVPMLSRGKTIGLITIYTNQPGRDFAPVDVGLAETIAGQVTGAVETARLFGQEQERRQEAERRRLIAESLGEILAILNANQPLEDTLDYISGQANRLLDSDANAIYRQEETEDDPFTVLAAQGYCAEEINATELPLGHSALQQALLTSQPLAFSDLSVVLADDTCQVEAGSPVRASLAELVEEFKTLLVVPLFVKDDSYGGIILYYRQPRMLTAEEIALAVIFSNQVTLAIENADLRLEAERSAVAAERNRLARELHDSVTQTLFSVAAIAEALPRVWDSHPAESKKALDELRRLTQGALAEMRNLLLELRPAVLVEKPMSELLRQLADAMMGRTRMQVTTTVVDERALPPEVKIGLYRIAQESLNNVTKHARASQVKIGLYYEPEQVELNITDNGLGFDPNTIAPGQLGVGIMAERAAALGATFEIDSRPDQGTQITVVWSDS